MPYEQDPILQEYYRRYGKPDEDPILTEYNRRQYQAQAPQIKADPYGGTLSPLEKSREALSEFSSKDIIPTLKTLSRFGMAAISPGAAISSSLVSSMKPKTEEEVRGEEIESKASERGLRVALAPLDPFGVYAEEAAYRSGLGPKAQMAANLAGGLITGLASGAGPRLAKSAKSIAEPALKLPQIAGGGLPFKPVEEVMSGVAPKAYNIRLDKIQGAEEFEELVRQETLNVSRVYGVDIRNMARGTRGHQVTIEAAEDILGKGNKSAELITRQVGKAYSAEELQAIRNLSNQAKIQAKKAAERALETGSQKDHMEAVYWGQVQLATQLRAHGAIAEAGRALDSLKILSNARYDPEYMKALSLALGDKDPLKVVKLLAGADPDNIPQAVRRGLSPNMWDKFHELVVASNLLNPAIKVRNAVSNTAMAIDDIATTAVRGGLDFAFSLGGLRRPRQFYAKEAVPKLAGYLGGIKSGAKYWVEAMWDEGARPFERTIEKLGGQTGTGTYTDAPQFAIKGFKGRAVRVGGRGLQADDQFFKAIAGNGEAWSLAARRVWQQKKPFSAANIMQEMASFTADDWTAVGNQAQKMTFTNDGELAKFIGSLRNAKIAGTKPLRWIILFSRTASNITERVAERAPGVGAILSGAKIFKGAKPAEALAPVALWQGIWAALGLSSLVEDGDITGGRPLAESRPQASQQFPRAAGWQPYSIRIGDQYYQIDKFDPVGQNIALLADARLAMDAGNVDGATFMLESALKSMVRGSPIGDLSEFLQAMSGDAFTSRGVTQFAGQQIAAMIPGSGALRATASTLDPMERDTTGFMGQIKASLPGIRETLPVKEDPFGRPVARQGMDIVMGTSPINQEELRITNIAEKIATEKRKVEDRSEAFNTLPDAAKLDRLLKAKQFLDELDSPAFTQRERKKLHETARKDPGALDLQERKELKELTDNVAKGLFRVYWPDNRHAASEIQRWAYRRGLRINFAGMRKADDQ
jgi:hypothetical protein